MLRFGNCCCLQAIFHKLVILLSSFVITLFFFFLPTTSTCSLQSSMASNFMASRMGTAPALENQIPERSYTTPATCLIHNCCSEPTFNIQTSNIRIKSVPFPSPESSFQSTRQRWRIAFALDTGGVHDNGGQEGINGNNSNLNATQLGRIVTAGGRQLLEKLNLARKNVPMKVFLLLLGFYTANA